MESTKNKKAVFVAALAAVVATVVVVLALNARNSELMSVLPRVPEFVQVPVEEEEPELHKEKPELDEEGHAQDGDDYTSTVPVTPAPAAPTAPAPAPAEEYTYAEYWSYNDGLIEGLCEATAEANAQSMIESMAASGAIMSGELMLSSSSTSTFVGDDGATYQRTQKVWMDIITGATSTTEEVVMISAPAPAPVAEVASLEVTANEITIPTTGEIVSEGAPAPAPQSETMENSSSEDSTASGESIAPAPGTVETVTVDGDTFNIIW